MRKKERERERESERERERERREGGEKEGICEEGKKLEEKQEENNERVER